MTTLAQVAPATVATAETVVVERIEVTPLLREQQVAAILNVAIKTLQKWRYEKTGPAYVKFGTVVRYELEALQSYIKERTQQP